MQAGVSFGAVVTDAGYGISAPFRQGLSALGLLWAAGIPRIQKVYPADVQIIAAPPTRGRAQDIDAGSGSGDGHAGGCSLAPRYLAAGHQVVAAGDVCCRASTARRVSASTTSPTWPPYTKLKPLALLIKARWVCEQAHQRLKPCWSALYAIAILG
jgi:hypothetical protein